MNGDLGDLDANGRSEAGHSGKRRRALLAGLGRPVQTYGVVVALAAAAFPSTAVAQGDSEGVRAGGFMVYPVLTVDVTSNDNVFAVETRTVDDTLVTVTPSIALNSDWSTHYIAANARATSKSFSDLSDQDTFEYSLGANGRIDVSRQANLFGNLSYTDGVEPLTETPTIGLVEPTGFTSSDVGAGASVLFNRLRLVGDVGSSTFDYSDGRTARGGIVDQDNRDRTQTRYGLRAEYNTGPGVFVFGAAQFGKVEYDQAPARGTASQDSDEEEVTAGVGLDISRLVRGEVGVGMFTKKFDDARLADVDGLRVKANITWNATPILTISANANRGPSESAASGSSSIVNTTVGANLSYAFRRNLDFTAGASFSNDDFRGIDREEERRNFSLGGLFRVNRIVGVTANYTITSKESAGRNRGLDFDQNTISIGLRLAR